MECFFSELSFELLTLDLKSTLGNFCFDLLLETRKQGECLIIEAVSVLNLILS